MEMPDFDPTASAQYVRYARGTNVPNGAKRHGPAAYSRVLPLNRLGTASTSSRRDSSASFRHGPSLAHIRAGTDRHGAVSAIAKRAAAKLARMPAADGCGVVEPSPGADVAGRG